MYRIEVLGRSIYYDLIYTSLFPTKLKNTDIINVSIDSTMLLKNC